MSKELKMSKGMGTPTANQNDTANKKDEKAEEYTIEYGGRDNKGKKEERIICLNCETEIKQGMQVCPICGKSPNYYKQYIPQTGGYSPTRKYRFPTVSLVMFLLSILGIIISVVMFIINHKNTVIMRIEKTSYEFTPAGWGDVFKYLFNHPYKWWRDDAIIITLFSVSVILLIIFGIRLIIARKRKSTNKK